MDCFIGYIPSKISSPNKKKNPFEENKH